MKPLNLITEPVARNVYGLGAGSVALPAPTSTVVWSSTAFAICEAMKRCQMSLYNLRWSGVRYLSTLSGLRAARVGRMASWASWARGLLRAYTGGDAGTYSGPKRLAISSRASCWATLATLVESVLMYVIRPV